MEGIEDGKGVVDGWEGRSRSEEREWWMEGREG